MRASKIGLVGLVGGAALYVLRGTGIGRRLREQVEALGSGDGSGEPARATQQGARRDVWPDVATEFEVDGDRILADREAQADRPVDPTADSSSLVEAERDALTVPGEDGEEHRRRDQTAGEAAQEIAAAQVRARRSGSAEFDEDE